MEKIIKNTKIKGFLALSMTLLLLAFTPISAFASSEEKSTDTSKSVSSEQSISPRAISGSNSGYVGPGGYGEFQIYSPGSGLWGHVDITVGISPVILTIIGPDGSNEIDNGSVLINPGSTSVRLLRPLAGTYKIKFQNTTQSQDGTYVFATLKDF